MQLISIGLPFYNAEDFLADAINSILVQTYNNWELVLADDGSKDKSLEIAKKFEQQDNRIKVFHDGKNKGLGARLNELAALFNGEYIARMDADDIMHPQRLQRQFEILENHPNIDVLGTNAYVIDENNLVFGIRYKNQVGLSKVEHFIHPTIMGKKQWFVDNPYDENAIRIEDAELWYRTKLFSNFYITYEPLLFYREFGKDYYKKYFSANSSKNYILEKHNRNYHWQKFYSLNYLKGSIYRLANMVSKEQFFINKRSEVIFIELKNIKDFI